MEKVKLEVVNNKNRFRNHLTQTKIKNALDHNIKKIDHLLLKTKYEYFVSANTKQGVYNVVDNLYFKKDKFAENWTTGFYSGMMWIAYQYTKSEKYLNIGKSHTKTFEKRMELYFSENRKLADMDHHDIGFLYLLSTKSDYQITKDLNALDITLKAADILMKRYVDTAGILQAWGDLDDKSQQGRLIIDCNMNVPLLYFAYQHTHNKKYKDAADHHLMVANKHLIREDASTFHTYFMDVDTGEPKYGATFQGLSDESSWARGQAWGILGFALAYFHNKDETYMKSSIALAHYFLNRLPKNLICNWDLVFLDNKGQRDTSAAAIAALGLIEIYEYNHDELYLDAAKKITEKLIDQYMDSNSEGLLNSGVYHYAINLGVDEALVFGDYFFMELLMKLYDDSYQSFWK